MNCSEEHEMWKGQVEKLKSSLNTLTNTDPKNLLQHFFLQALQTEFSHELETTKTNLKNIICEAALRMDRLQGSTRERAAAIIKEIFPVDILTHIRLSDIRNKAVFEIYRQCAYTVDTYVERYSSPPGTEEQNRLYGIIAHGSARATARQTARLSNVLIWMQVLKRFFIVYDSLSGDTELTQCNLNWIGAMWKCHVDEKSLGDLVWSLFLDIWYIEN